MASPYDFTFKTLTGGERSLADFKGQVMLVVNVASQCGYTPQYKGLQALHTELGPKGLAVLGFPANEFGAQEPGSDKEIATFCESKFGVTFPMFSKIVVKGPGKHAFYAYLTERSKPAGEVGWNFEKFLIGRDGAIVGRFSSRVAPESKELRDAILAALG